VIGGGGVLVRPIDAEPIELVGRESPFEALPWAAYLPSGASGSGGKTVRSSAEGRPSRPGARVRIAIAEAPRGRVTGVAEAAITIRPADIAVEIRGAGHSTRQINHIVAPDFPADRLLLVEVLTPAGNWSSWPPHKHDVDDMPNEAVLEEVYHYAFRRPEAWAIQRLYRPPGGPLGAARDGVWAVRDGDVVLVTDGYHPFAATDADDAYYLNALAGDRRTMACSFDPDLDQVRARWATEPPDPRVPLVRAGA
jgi:5-deoxy-glucuronate isomerase